MTDQKQYRGNFASIVYYFPGQPRQRVVDAMLQIPCIHIASDTYEMICIEPLEFGVYEISREEESTGPYWKAFLRGNRLTHEIFQQAKGSFERHGGRDAASMPPPPPAQATDFPSDSDPVEYVSQQCIVRGGSLITKNKFKAGSRQAALKFLKTKSTSDPTVSFEVQTPDGVVGKDRNGIY